jgi:PAS domain S-box-containing protein
MFENENLNPVIGDILSEIEKQNLQDENRILLISDRNLNVAFVSSFLDRWRRISSLNEIITEPDLASMLAIFIQNKINSLNLEISIDWREENEILDYKVDITKLHISKIEYFLLVFESLNKRSKLERKINSLTYALDYGGIPVIIIDENSEIIYSSSKFEEILNVEIEELYRTKLDDILSPKITMGELNILKHALENHETWKKTLIIEKNGKTFYYEFLLLPVDYEEGSPKSFILTAHDITDFILKHQEIRRSEKWLHSIIDNISDMLAVFQFDEKNRCLLKISNRSFNNYIGVSNITGYGITDLFQTEEAELILQQMSRVKEKGKKNVHFECKLNETEPIYEAVGTIMFDPIDEKDYYIFIFKDISNRIAYERQLEIAFKEELRLNKMKNEFLENMSHELRTPANAIIGYSEILDDAVKEKDIETISEVAPGLKEVINRLVKLFDNIVDIAEVKSNEIKIKIERIDLNVPLNEVAANFENLAASKGLNFKTEIFEGNLWIEGDKEVLQKIFYALIDNAVKYTDEGKVFIKSYAENNFAYVEITDTGKGIDEKKLNELLIPFNQGEEGYTRNFQGAGLGLSLAYRLTLMIGGKLFINSNKHGTTITLQFPLTDKN